MKSEVRKLATRFAPETRFEVRPVPTALSRGALEAQLETLKNQLLFRLLDETPEPAVSGALRYAANEAAALAWTTPFPLLVLPTLLEEKAQAARRYVTRAEQLRRHGQPLCRAA